MATPPTPTKTFWGNANAGKGQLPVETTGDQQAQPTTHVPGAGKGHRPADYVAAARAVYPHYDGVTNALPAAKPATWNDAVPADFATWHSSHQAEFLKVQKAGAGNQLRVPATGTPIEAYFVLRDDGKPLNLASMTLQDYTQLTANERSKYNTILLNTLGKAAEWGMEAPSARAGLITALNTMKAAMTSPKLTAAQEQVFKGQIDLIIKGIPADSGVKLDDIKAQASEVLKRFERVKAFAEAPVPQEVLQRAIWIKAAGAPTTESRDNDRGSISLNLYAASTDNNAKIREGLEEFMRAERAISTMKHRRDAIASASYADPKRDVPNLIYQLQMMYEGEAESVADSGTEEIRQLHALLQNYAKMQALVSRQQALYDPSKPGEQRRLGDIGRNTVDGTIDTQQVMENGILARNNTGMAYQWYVPGGSAKVFGDNYNGSSADASYHAGRKDLPRFHWSLLGQDTATAGMREMMARMPSSYLLSNAERFIGPVYTPEEMDVLSMFMGMGFFSGYQSGPNPPATQRDHPLEALLGGIKRPVIEFIDKGSWESLKLMRKNEWDAYGTQLAETVTQLNQQNQIKQSEIDSATKQKNRHFELGNNALRKMNDILMSIGRI